MAKSRASQRKQGQPESKRALIIFLVFFILTTIGGGLFGYQGYMADQGKDDKIKQEVAKSKGLDDQSTFYEYQALLYRRYLGQTLPDDKKARLDTLDRQFKEATESWASFKDKDDLKAVVIDLDKRLKFASPEKPPRNFDEALKDQIRAAEAAKADIKPFIVQKDDDKKRADTAVREMQTDKETYTKNLKDLAKKLEDDQKGLVDQKESLKKLLEQAQADKEKVALELAEVKKKAQMDLVKKDKDIADLAKRAELLEIEVNKVKFKDIEVPDLQMRSVGRVVDRKGESAFINLGLVQRMTPQVTFSIHAAGPDGQPLPQSKGSVEVVNVFETGSQGKILLEKNKNDPIQQGDLIVNPNWNPDRRKHVAIAGLVDLTGEGRNQMREFRQVLERQGVIVDAFLEPQDNNWVVSGKGISRETNFLIMGEDLPDTKGADASGASKNLQDKNAELVKQARQNGVFIVSLRNYLDMIGYQPPRGLGESSGPVYAAPAPAAPAPAPAPPPAPAPEKKEPMPEKKEPMPEKKDPAPAPEKM
jgi:hypothetical protein